MWRKLLIAGAIVLVAGIAVKKLGVTRHIGSAIQCARDSVHNSIPMEVKFKTLENQISDLGNHVQQLADPIAELEFDIAEHKKEVTHIKAQMQGGEEFLQSAVDELDSGLEVLQYGGKQYTRQQYQQKVSVAFATYQRYETHLKTKTSLLDAKVKRLDALYQQAEQTVAKKREFEVRLANLRAEQARIAAEAIANRPVRENGLIKEIDDEIRQLEREQKVRARTAELLKNDPFNIGNNSERAPQRTAEPNLQEIRNHLNGNQQPVIKE